MKKLFATMFSLALLGCTVSDSTAQEVLTDEGYHDIHLEGYAWFDCGEDDTFQSNFTAKRWIVQDDGSRTERTVHGTLCCGLWKNCTVRH